LNYFLLLIFVLLVLVPVMGRVRNRPGIPRWLNILLLIILVATIFSAILFGIIFPK
jgi:hypothetical protein